jgi:dolichyl-phosphate-mannose-protein mannosyltransferase
MMSSPLQRGTTWLSIANPSPVQSDREHSRVVLACESSISVPVPRTELIAILVITLVGIAARFAFLDELAIEHFDEGVYASNLWFPDEGYQYPDRFLYAPPLVPSLIEWSMMIFNQARWAPFLPSLLLGSLTVPVVWWTVRRWANGMSGIAAASLISLSDFHIAMSRSALTDVPMVFFLLVAVWLTIEALSGRYLRLAAVAGFATGLAWCTKYNGWLPVAIAISGSVAAWLTWPRGRKGSDSDDSNLSVSSNAACLAVMTLMAALTWLPVWWELQPIGGYARVADNHSNYVTGFAEWWPNAVKHEVMQRHFAGWPTLLSGWLAVLSAAFVLRVERSTWNESLPRDDDSKGGSSNAVKRSVKRSTWNDASDTSKQLSKASSQATEPPVKRSTWNEFRFVMTVAIASALAGAIVLSPVVALGVWSLTELVASALTLRRNRQRCLQDSADKMLDGKRSQKPGKNGLAEEQALLANEQAHRSWFGVWLHLAWLCGLVFATPLYRPYPRLILPLLCVGCVGTGLAIVRLLRGRLVTGSSSEQNLGLSRQDSSDESATQTETTRLDENLTNDRTDESGEVVPEVPPTSPKPSMLRFIWLTAVVCLCVWRAVAHSAPAWQNRSALATIADQAVAAAAENCKGEPGLNANLDFVIYVYGEPGLFFHIPSDRVATNPVMNLSFARPGSSHSRGPTFVLAGPHAWRSSQFGEQYRELPDDALIEVAEFPYQVSDFVLLDDHSPSQLSKHRQDVVKLYRVQFR